LSNFGTLNWSILIAYVIGNLYLGYVLGKKIDSAEDFFLGRLREFNKARNVDAIRLPDGLTP